MPKRVRTPQQIEADRQRMAKVRAARESKETMLQNADKGAAIPEKPASITDDRPPVLDTVVADKKEVPQVELDLTDRALDSEAQLHQYLLWEFDEGRTPNVIKVTSHQASNISSFTKQRPLRFYQSTFGNHYFKIVSAKEMQNVQEA